MRRCSSTSAPKLVAGVGAQYELTPRAIVGARSAGASSRCRARSATASATASTACRASRSSDADYFAGAKARRSHRARRARPRCSASPPTSPPTSWSAPARVGARGDDFRVTTGLVWSPQPAGVAAPGRNDHDGDGIPDSVDACPDEAEDKDGFQDEDGCPDADNDGDGIADGNDECPNEPEDKDGFQDDDGCPERDNDNDGIPDAADKCPNDAEDTDGFEDDDGCPDQDNDGDGFPDAKDKCPNDAETVNGFDDDDGCPDVRATTGPEERADRIDLKGQQVAFDKTGQADRRGEARCSTQVATIIKNRKLTIRIEVHVARSARRRRARPRSTRRRPKDKQAAQQRAARDLRTS